MDKIKSGIRKFQDGVHPALRETFESLAAGQSPEVLLITCSDSRIDPSLVTQSQPGELFVIRNAGNLVAPYGSAGSAEAGTIEFAIKALGVKHVVVCGHAHCGAMAGVLDPSKATGLPALEAWLELAGPKRLEDPDATVDDQVRANVREQLDHLRTHPSVREAESAGTIALHGWVYDFVSGRIDVLNETSAEFAPITDQVNA